MRKALNAPEALPGRAPTAILMAALAPVLLAGCGSTVLLTPSDHETVLANHTIEAPDPGERGPHEVSFLYYGSGTDRTRAEYRDSVTIVTDTVDASRIINLGGAAEEREKYWGFGPDAFPLNGRVWYPEGDGPFPLVLIVHGNHNPSNPSDPGYEYLGELLASRGMIGVSLDMNFVNSLHPRENDVRGWLFLRHLDAWKGFHEDPDSPFHDKVDWERIALIGHSRGGEAVGHAAAFNRLTHYPDDGSVRFDFDYDIRALVAIAPVDGQYRPMDRFVPVEDVSYLVFHGSHDGDVTAFHGLRQYDRVALSPGSRHIRSAVYVYRANHGQWNEVWGARDRGPRSARILDLDHLLAPEDQRRFAEVYISAFLEYVLREDDRYLPFLRDHRTGGDWLPPTMYITRLRTGDFRPLADFSEDVDLTTGTAPGVRLRADSMATWREGELLLRSRNNIDGSASQQIQALHLGWNNRLSGEDTPALGPPARFHLRLPETLAAEWGVSADSRLEITLGGDRTTPGPRTPPEDDEEDEATEPGAAVDPEEGPDEPSGADTAEAEDGSTGDPVGSRDSDGEDEALDLTIEVEDAAGVVASVSLSRYGAIRRPLEISIMRRRDLEPEMFANQWEQILQDYSIPFADFIDEAPDLDPTTLREIRLVFDRTEAGSVVVGEIGIDVEG
ncbi:MAG: hypothetical protein EA351_06315 [Gemmatimonadales bacterium]|nr:MAG: hypothetical protein EA351_06315 [Gemmatimonadales bacterium]